MMFPLEFILLLVTIIAVVVIAFPWIVFLVTAYYNWSEATIKKWRK